MTAERMTRANLDARVENLNSRMTSRGSIYRYSVEMRNGYCALDRANIAGARIDLVRIGTKAEIGEFVHAMMVALDDASYVDDRRAS